MICIGEARALAALESFDTADRKDAKVLLDAFNS